MDDPGEGIEVKLVVSGTTAKELIERFACAVKAFLNDVNSCMCSFPLLDAEQKCLSTYTFFKGLLHRFILDWTLWVQVLFQALNQLHDRARWSVPIEADLLKDCL